MNTTLLLRIALALCAFGLPAAAQVLGGTVTDRATHKPLIRMPVSLQDSSTIVNGSTDSTGSFYLTAPRAGTYTLVLGADGPRQVAVDSIEIADGEFVQRAFAIDFTPVYLAYEVATQAKQMSRTGDLRYPPQLRAQGLNGRVLAQFVVDTSGRIRQGSFRAIRSNHPLFASAVRAALPSMRFVPATREGAKVAQLVRQTFTVAP